MHYLTKEAREKVKDSGDLADRIGKELDTTVSGVFSMVSRNSHTLTSYYVVNIIAEFMAVSPEKILEYREK